MRARDRHQRDLVTRAEGAQQRVQQHRRRRQAARRRWHRGEEQDAHQRAGPRVARRRDSQSSPAAYAAWASPVNVARTDATRDAAVAQRVRQRARVERRIDPHGPSRLGPHAPERHRAAAVGEVLAQEAARRQTVRVTHDRVRHRDRGTALRRPPVAELAVLAARRTESARRTLPRRGTSSRETAMLFDVKNRPPSRRRRSTRTRSRRGAGSRRRTRCRGTRSPCVRPRARRASRAAPRRTPRASLDREGSRRP